MLAVGQQQNPAIRVVQSTTRPRAAACQETLSIRKERRWYRGQPRTEVSLRKNSSAKPVVDPRMESLGSLPPIEWPDADGFYAALVLRQMRARFQQGWNLSEHGRASAQRTLGGPSLAAKSARAKLPLPSGESLIVAEASAGVLGEPFETLLTELAQRRVRLPASGRRCL